MPDPENHEQAHILVVDDEPQLAELLRVALSGRFSVRAVIEPKDALALCAAGGVRLLLTDYSMPGMTGVELVRKARELRPELHTVLFSGNLSAGAWAAAVNSGCRHVLRKPLSLKTILDLCALLLKEGSRGSTRWLRTELASLPSSQGPLGRALRRLHESLRLERCALLITSEGGASLQVVLASLVPEVRPWTPAGGARPRAPIIVELESLSPGAQQELHASLLDPARAPAIVTSSRPADVLLETGDLSTNLYLRLSRAQIPFPTPGECADEVAELAEILQSPPGAPSHRFERSARVWLAETAARFSWQELGELVEAARRSAGNSPVQVVHFQRALLASDVGPAFAALPTYTEFLDVHTRRLRSAWDMLGRLPE